MEKHKCKLCTRSFTSGRALGGHMKAHLANFSQVENPKKCLNLSDLKLSFSTAEYIVHDKESETESRNPTQKRTNRNPNRKVAFGQNSEQKKLKQIVTDSHSPEPISSISETSPEHEVAITLMMLSRDKWNINVVVEESQSQSQSEEVERSMAEIKFTKANGRRKCEKCGMSFRSSRAMESHNNICLQNEVATTSSDHKIFKCLFCSKVFGSGQALGGHKRSHFDSSSKKKNCFIDLNLPPSQQENNDRDHDDHSIFYE